MRVGLYSPGGPEIFLLVSTPETNELVSKIGWNMHPEKPSLGATTEFVNLHGNGRDHLFNELRNKHEKFANDKKMVFVLILFFNIEIYKPGFLYLFLCVIKSNASGRIGQRKIAVGFRYYKARRLAGTKLPRKIPVIPVKFKNCFIRLEHFI